MHRGRGGEGGGVHSKSMSLGMTVRTVDEKRDER